MLWASWLIMLSHGRMFSGFDLVQAEELVSCSMTQNWAFGQAGTKQRM